VKSDSYIFLKFADGFKSTAFAETVHGIKNKSR